MRFWLIATLPPLIECSICGSEFDPRYEGIDGQIGLVPFALCTTCKAGVYDWACQQWGDDEE